MIAIIGGGASGALTAAQIGIQAEEMVRVTLFDSSATLGKGLAYGTRNFAHLLNVPAGKISALPSKPNHFLDWLNRTGNVTTLLNEERIGPADFVPRGIYGCYLADLVEEVYDHPRCQAKLTLESSRVIDFIPGAQGGTLLTAEGNQHEVSHLILATGNLPPHDPLATKHPLLHSDRYVPIVWKQGAMETFPSDGVLIVGSGLTAIDVVLSLQASGYQGNYFVVSRGGYWPQTHQPSVPFQESITDRLSMGNIRELMKDVRLEISKIGEENWRSVMDALRPYTQELWRTLPLKERRRFLRHVRRFWESHRHRVPPKPWAQIVRLQQEDRLELIAGRLDEFVEDEEGVSVRIKLKHSHAVRSLRVQKIYNCVGLESNFCKQVNDPLVNNLMERGLVQPDPLLLGLDATGDFQAIGAGGRVYERISLIGPPLRGVLWETTAIPEIRVQAMQIADRVLRQSSVNSWSI